MEVLKRRPEVDDSVTVKRAKVDEVAKPVQVDSDSEDEAELLDRLFGGNKPQGPVQPDVESESEIEKEEQKDEKPIVVEENDNDNDCVWHDEDDDEVQ